MDSATKERLKKSAEKLVQQGKIDAAIVEFRKVLDADPRDLTTANTVGDLHVRKGATDEAKRFFIRVAEGYESEGAHIRTVAMLKKINKLDPSDTDVAIKLAQVYVSQGHLGEAQAQYASAVAALRKKGRIRDALRVMKRSVDMDPTDLKARMALADEYANEGFAAEAGETWRVAALEHFRRDESEEGIHALRRALEYKPDSRPALKSLAEAYAARGDVQPALDMIARSLEMDPNDIDLIIILGRTFRNAGMLEKAEATFNRLFELDNSRYEYLLEIAGAYIERGENVLALGIIDRCIEVILARRHKKKATALLKAILKNDPDNLHALKRLAAIYKSVRERRNLIATLNSLVPAAMRQNLRAEAVVALKQLIEIDPGKVAYQEQLDSLGDELAPTRVQVAQADEIYDSYGDYSTELLEEMVAQHPEFMAARLNLLEELVAQQPDYLDGRLKLKQLYVDDGQKAKAASQCLDIARVHESRGEGGQARRALREAFLLNPELKGPGGRGRSAPLDTGPLLALAPPRASAGAQTREEFAKSLDAAWRRTAHARKPLSCLMLAVDRFATFEEQEGVDSASASLVRIAGALESQLKVRGGVLASDGSAEFYALLPETHPGTAGTVAEAMRKTIEELAIPHPNGRSLTMSIGVATAFPHRLEGPDEMADAITQAVATAQHAGGNRVVSAPLIGA